MLKKIAASLAAVLVLGASTAAFACPDGSSASAAAWSGAWLQRTPAGAITVAAVAPGSAAAKAGLRAGDIVTAVNGHSVGMGACPASASCPASKCTVGSAVTYNVQRGHSTRVMRVKLETMPAQATQRYANRAAEFDPALFAVVMPAAR